MSRKDNDKYQKSSRNPMSIADKINVIQQIEKGEKIFDVHKRLGIPFAAVINIWKCREQIKHYSDYRGKFEEALLSWCLEQKKNGIPLGERHIKKEARRIAKAIDLTNFNLKDKWLNGFISQHSDYLVITDTQTNKRTIIKNFLTIDPNDQGSAYVIQEEKLDTVINTANEEKENIDELNSALPINEEEDRREEIKYCAAEQKENKDEELEQIFYLLDEENVDLLVVKDENSESEEEYQRGYSEHITNIKKEIRDDIEDDPKSIIPPTALVATTISTFICEQSASIEVFAPSIQSVPSFVLPDTLSALNSKPLPDDSSSSCSLSSLTAQFIPTASSSTTSEPPPTIQEALDAVDVLGRFLSICGENPIVTQRLKEILGLGKS